MDSSILKQIKDMIKKQVYHKYEKNKADRIWKDMEEKPDHWWNQEQETIQKADTTTLLLGEVQGYANILRAAPWRTGYSQGSLKLYTSDNPIAGYLRTIRIFGEGAAFSSFDYFVPLSPMMLLVIERRPRKGNDNEKRQPRGDRWRKDYSDWEISFARHVVTNDAKKYLFGEGTIINKECAGEYFKRIAHATIEFSSEYLGFGPQSHFPIFG